MSCLVNIILITIETYVDFWKANKLSNDTTKKKTFILIQTDPSNSLKTNKVLMIGSISYTEPRKG